MKKNGTNVFSKLLLGILFLFLCQLFAFGQVTGNVTDADGNPLPGVNIIIKGTLTGTITNADGNYNIEVEDTDATLVFSFIGYRTQEIKIAGRNVINITLEEEAISLEEVVAIGYGTMKKSDLTGSVTSISSEELAAYPSLGITEAIQGRASGVQVTSKNGEPGAENRILIRGGTSINASSSPLYVVDGFAGGTVPPPADIESIEILKDASATAIYGSRGANDGASIDASDLDIGEICCLGGTCEEVEEGEISECESIGGICRIYE